MPQEDGAALAAGTFYWDRALARIYYLPRLGEDMSRVAAVVAAEEVLVTIMPGAANHHFDGVAFEYATWLQPGQAGTRQGRRIPDFFYACGAFAASRFQ